ncbi:MAG: NAD-binding protein [Nanoarchaeota archaeon]|nr:NAD-binding protein [Nanoarchaeota archaeon]
MIEWEDVKGFLLTLFLFVSFLFLFAVTYSYITGESLSKAVGDALVRIFGMEDVKASLTSAMFLFLSSMLIWFVVDYIVRILVKLELGGVTSMVKAKGMRDHYIICGFGRVGSHVAKRLKKEKKKVLVIDVSEEALKEARGYPVIKGDCLQEKILKLAGIKKAKAIICALGKPESNVFLTITAKHLNPSIIVGARADDADIAAKLRHAGADVIIMPEAIGGYKLAEEVMKKG